jgi:inhibitor of cysteine peptidase
MQAASWTNRAVVLSLTLVSLMFIACGSLNVIELNADDDATEIEMEVEQEVLVSLEANPTTGYIWAVDSDVDSSLWLVGEIEFESESNLAGAGGMQTLQFKALAPGEGDLTLIYHRPFEPDAEPLREFSVSVVVK